MARPVAHLVTCPLVALALALAVATAVPARAEPPAEATSAAEELVRRERVRAAIVAAIELFQKPDPSGAQMVDNQNRAVESIAELGPDAVGFLTAELDEGMPDTFRLVAHALGRIPTPESEAALRRAMRRADKDLIGDWPVLRKAWAGWALGLQRVPDVIELLDAGTHKAAHVSIHSDTSVLEAATIQLGDAAVPRLIAALAQGGEEDAAPVPRSVWVLRALRRSGAPVAVPHLARALAEGERPERYHAARALGAIPGTESVAALLGALEDEDPVVRRSVASALERLQPREALTALVARLDQETDSVARATLYRTIARLGGDSSLEALRAQRGKLDADDRRGLVEAMGLIASREATDFLRGAVTDRDSRVAFEAVRQLARIGSPRALDAVLVAIRDERWPVAQTAIEELAWYEIEEAAPRLAGRLLAQELSGVVTDPLARLRIEKLGEALAVLAYDEPLEDLREAAARQTDAGLVEYLGTLSGRLALVRANGTDVERWTNSTGLGEPELHAMAYRALGRIGGPDAARALVAALGRANDPRDAEAVVRALGVIDHPLTREALERVLLDPAYDPPALWPVRDVAAWSARRLGGPRMRDALERSAVRRSGRDARVLVYLAQLDPQGTLPLLRELRPLRMSYLKWLRGEEQEQLDRIAEAIAAGRPLDEWDVAPERLRFGP